MSHFLSDKQGGSPPPPDSWWPSIRRDSPGVFPTALCLHPLTGLCIHSFSRQPVGQIVSGTEGAEGKQCAGPLELVFPWGGRLQQSLVRAGCGSHSFILTSPSGGLQGWGPLACESE